MTRSTAGGESYSLIIVGGGPAGLFCAALAAGKDKRVLLLEKNPTPGRKLLMTGAGQCNITHEGDVVEFINHYGENGKFLKPALMNFRNRDLVKFFGERGLPVTTEPGGRVFPASRWRFWMFSKKRAPRKRLK